MFRTIKFSLITSLIVMLSLLITLVGHAQEAANVTVTENVQLSNVKPFGVNIGGYNQFGAANYAKNLIPNPGFEGADFGMLFLANAPSVLVLPETNVWHVQADWQIGWNPAERGHPDGHWLDGNYEVVSGEGMWQRGKVTWFANEDARYTFYLEGLVQPIKTGDAIVVRKPQNGYDADVQPYNVGQLNDVRPGSPGVQSLRLLPPDGFASSWAETFDTFGAPAAGFPNTGDSSAGKLYIVDGQWHFNVWAKGTAADSALRVRFRRIGQTTFYEETFDLTQEWQEFDRIFSVNPSEDLLSAPAAGLQIELFVVGDSAVVIDDITLERANQANPTEFNDKFVTYLQGLQPGIIRGWGGQRGQLGSTLDNQLAIPHGRRATEYRPEHKVARGWHYSLHDFLTLCKIAGAEPWYVIPPTWTREELGNFTAYLNASPGEHPYANLRSALGQPVPWSDEFETIHLEIGNEIWGSNGGGDPFIGASLRGGARAGQFASARMGVMKQSEFYYEPRYNFIIGGQAFFAGRQKEIADNSINHNTIGIAPYYGELESFNGDAERFHPLYGQFGWLTRDSHVTDSKAFLDAANTNMAIYELNLHANRRDGIDIETRNDFLTGQGAAISLPLLMMQYQQQLGIRDQLAFEMLQYSTFASNLNNGSGDWVRIFGLLRDLEATGRRRPTWYALEMANRASRGDMLTVDVTSATPISFYSATNNGLPRADMDSDFEQSELSVSSIQAFAYREGSTYRLVLYNLNLANFYEVNVSLPLGATVPSVEYDLTASSLYDTNEDALNVMSVSKDSTISGFNTLRLSPHSMKVIEWTVQ